MSDRPDSGARGDASWAIPLIPLVLSGGLLGAITYHRIYGSSAENLFARLVRGIVELFGFEPSFMVAALVLVWSSIWFFGGRVERPLGRLSRIAALGFCLAVLVGLRADGNTIESGGRIGSFLGQRLGGILSPGFSSIVVGLAVLASLLLATDFLFFGYFKRLADRVTATLNRGVAESATTPHPSASDAARASARAGSALEPEPVEGVERAAIAELESLRLDQAPAPEPQAPASTASEFDVDAELRALGEDESPATEADALARVEALPEPGTRRARRLARSHAPGAGPEADESAVLPLQEDVEAAPSAAEADALDALALGEAAAPAEGASVGEMEHDDEDPRLGADFEAATVAAAAAAPADDGHEPLTPALAAGSDDDADEDFDDEPADEPEDRVDDESNDESDDESDDGSDDELDDDAAAEPAGAADERVVVLFPSPQPQLQADREARDEPAVATDPEAITGPEAIVELERPTEAPQQQRLFGADRPDDALVEEARELVRRYRRASVTFLQRRLRVRAEDAVALMRELSRRGIVECGDDITQGRVVLEP